MGCTYKIVDLASDLGIMSSMGLINNQKSKLGGGQKLGYGGREGPLAPHRSAPKRSGVRFVSSSAWFQIGGSLHLEINNYTLDH